MLFCGTDALALVKGVHPVVFIRCKLSTEELMQCLFHTRAIRDNLQTKKKFSRFWPSKQLHHLESVGED
jgi:hypothetical protein